jgi:hypothetical protein
MSDGFTPKGPNAPIVLVLVVGLVLDLTLAGIDYDCEGDLPERTQG